MPIQPNDRVCLFGRTGSGKTTLARALLGSTRSRWVVLDAKHTYRDGETPIVAAFNRRLDRQIIRVPPSRGELGLWEQAIDAAWRDGDRLMYVDEATLITPPTRILPALGKAIRTGRERGVGVLVGSQRPKDLPSAIFTEAEHFFIFRLTFEADREKVVSFTADSVEPVLRKLRGHSFAYYNVLDDTVKHLKLKVG